MTNRPLAPTDPHLIEHPATGSWFAGRGRWVGSRADAFACHTRADAERLAGLYAAEFGVDLKVVAA